MASTPEKQRVRERLVTEKDVEIDWNWIRSILEATINIKILFYKRQKFTKEFDS